MPKHLIDLSKDEKILLLKAYADGEVDPDKISEYTLFSTGRGCFFSCIMVAASPGCEMVNIVCLGEEAKADRKLFDSLIELPELNFDRIESGLYRCKEKGEELTEAEVKALAKDYNYMISVEVTSDLTKPAAGYKLIPKKKEDFINELKK